MNWSENPESGVGQFLDPSHGGATGYDPSLTARGKINPATEAALRQMGYTGDLYSDTPDSQSSQDSGGNNQPSQLNPALMQWMQEKGIKPSAYAEGTGSNIDFTGPDGNLIGSTHNEAMQAPEFMAAMAAGLGGFGAMAGGLTSASAGTDLAQGAGALGDVAYNPYTGPGSTGFQVAGDNAVAPAGWGAAGGAEGSGAAADAAGMGLAEGAYPAGLGTSMSQAGGAGGLLSSASSWMKDNPMLTNIGGSLANGLIGAYTSNKALGAQTDATNQANALWAPYRDAGTNAIGKMTNLLQNPNSITQDPGYQFQLGQGQQAVDRSAASKGGLYSGATLKALQRYGTDYAGTKLDQTMQRYGNVAQLGATGTQNTSNNLTNLGQAGAGAAMYQGNVLQNGVNNALGQFNYSNGGPNPYGQSQYTNGLAWKP